METFTVALGHLYVDWLTKSRANSVLFLSPSESSVLFGTIMGITASFFITKDDQFNKVELGILTSTESVYML